ncbi:MAG: SDR family NAD(P)-dependent oxidoreductase, partial [Gammaproteobacteria bacterium]|nr:SDR family NAD(P)-dependent oxidoreductase [Gammaproteobacteria bacterium]
MLSGKVVLITGASKGIGKAIAELFALNGATLFLNARTEGSLEDFASKLTEKYQVGVYPQYFDVADVDAIKQVFQLI